MKLANLLLFVLFTSNLSAEEVTSNLDLLEVYKGAPWIYILLFLMSVASFSLWLYSIFTLRKGSMLPDSFFQSIRQLIVEKRFEAALSACRQEKNFSAPIIACGLAARKHGPQMMLESMQSEGKRSSNNLWQRISFLNEVAFVAPMLGLLGTVLGLFFAFYDTSHAPESLSNIFDGFGIAVGTTVAGLVVAILAMIFSSILKFRIINLLNSIENELLSLVNIADLDSAEKTAKTGTVS